MRRMKKRGGECVGVLYDLNDLLFFLQYNSRHYFPVSIEPKLLKVSTLLKSVPLLSVIAESVHIIISVLFVFYVRCFTQHRRRRHRSTGTLYVLVPNVLSPRPRPTKRCLYFVDCSGVAVF